MKLVKSDSDSQQEALKKESSFNAEIRAWHEHIMRLGFIAVGMGLFCFVFAIAITFIILYCLQIITPPWYIISPIVSATITGVGFMVRRIVNYMLPVKNSKDL